VVAGTTSAKPSFVAFINQADAVDLPGLMIADGLHWMQDWYASTGDSSDYLVDQFVQWPTAEAEAFASEFETRWGYAPSPSVAGLAYDGANLFIAAAQAVYQETGALSSETLYAFTQDEIWTGQWTFDDGIMMASYKYAPDTIPDPVVGEGFYLFPIVQSFGGEDFVVFPPAWADQPLTPPPGSR
jgi:branched-chain amino acid transport system substrate-binding protein